ncbi:MAG: DHH family phosphoesterase [Oscillospiraceae bacterium]|jgi:phosphoesterase RecJ-like protein
MIIDLQKAARLLREWDDILILTHQKPDGDAYGSAFALLWALESIGKRARVETPDGYLPGYRFLFGDYSPRAFEPRFLVTTDVAGPQLLGPLAERWAHRIDLCIDHHKINHINATFQLVVPQAAATCQLTWGIIRQMGVAFTPAMAGAVYTGIATDTGCFRYANTTPEVHRIAADMMEAGADHALINKLMFDTKSKGRLEIDRLVLDTLEYYFDGRCAMISIPNAAVEQAGVSEEELDGIAGLPRSIEGVQAGVTLREKPDGNFRVSLRTTGSLDASVICGRLGGGGHKNAAGCTVPGPLEEAKKQVLAAMEPEIAQRR